MSAPATTKIPLLDLSRQWKSLEREVLAEVEGVFRENDFILGRRVGLLEKEMAALCATPMSI